MREPDATPAIVITQFAQTRTFRVQSWTPAEPNVSALHEVIGTAWPRTVGEVAEGRLRVLCIGPTDWIVVAASDGAPQIFEALSSVAREAGLSVVEVSDALPVVRLSGSGVRDALSQGCGVDLHPGALAAGRCVRTRLAQVPVILHRTADESSFDCYVSRSYRAHLTTWLTGAHAPS